MEKWGEKYEIWENGEIGLFCLNQWIGLSFEFVSSMLDLIEIMDHTIVSLYHMHTCN